MRLAMDLQNGRGPVPFLRKGLLKSGEPKTKPMWDPLVGDLLSFHTKSGAR